MKTTIKLFLFALLSAAQALAQTALVVPPSNVSTSGMEKNMLFFADRRFAVSQQGSISFPLSYLFDGNYTPLYSSAGIDPNNPYVITIENLPNINTQQSAWIGWTTRAYAPTKFKIEIYNIYDFGGAPGLPALNTWITVADVNNYGSNSYMLNIANFYSSVGKIRFTFYQASGPNNVIGLSELFFIHPEATVAYDNLMVKYDSNGNVGIGTGNTNGYQLAVNGNIHAKQVNVDLNNWSDYVFAPKYSLKSLSEVKAYIDKNHHLPGVPSEQEMVKNGLDVGEMNKLLMKKVEELTLYLIEKDEVIKEMDQKRHTELKNQSMTNKKLQAQFKALQNEIKKNKTKIQS